MRLRRLAARRRRREKSDSGKPSFRRGDISRPDRCRSWICLPRWLCRPLTAEGSRDGRSDEHTSELQSLMRISYAVFCLKKKTQPQTHKTAIKRTQQKKQTNDK